MRHIMTSVSMVCAAVFAQACLLPPSEDSDDKQQDPGHGSSCGPTNPSSSEATPSPSRACITSWTWVGVCSGYPIKDMLTFELPPINGPSVGQATVGVVDSSVQNTTYPIWRVPPDDAAQNAYEPDRQSGIAMIITHSSVGLGASDEEAYQQAVKALGLSWPRGLFEGKSCQPHRIEDPEVVAPDKRKLTSENVVRLLRAAQRQDAGKETLGSIVDDMQDAVPTWRQNCDTADNVPYLSTRSTSELQDEVVPWLKRTSNISPGSWITAGEQR